MVRRTERVALAGVKCVGADVGILPFFIQDSSITLNKVSYSKIDKFEKIVVKIHYALKIK